MNKIIYTPDAPAAIGPYSQGVDTGSTLYVSGQIPAIPATGALLEGSVADKTRLVLNNIGAILKAAGYTFADVVKTTVFLKDMGYFAEMNGAYAEYFPQNPPARACVQVAGLPRGVDVEIEVVAVK